MPKLNKQASMYSPWSTERLSSTPGSATRTPDCQGVDRFKESWFNTGKAGGARKLDVKGVKLG